MGDLHFPFVNRDLEKLKPRHSLAILTDKSVVWGVLTAYVNKAAVE